MSVNLKYQKLLFLIILSCLLCAVVLLLAKTVLKQKEIKFYSSQVVTDFDLLPSKAYCRFDSRKVSAVLLYSAPVASALFLLNAFDDPAIKGLFKYYLFNGHRYHGEIVWSGVTLSPRQLRSLPLRTIIFADPNEDLKKALKVGGEHFGVIDVITLAGKTTSAQLWRVAMTQLKPYFILDPICEQRLKILEKWVNEQEKKWHALTSKVEMYFFLGPLSEHRWPTYVIANDLLSRDLIEANVIKWSFPFTEQGTLNWSQRLMERVRQGIFIGLSEDLSLPLGVMKLEKLDDHRFNIKMSGVLLPGITQLLFGYLLLTSGIFKW